MYLKRGTGEPTPRGGHPPFVILALPRSRTKWLSTFLTYGTWHCGHDELRHCRSLDDVASWFAQPLTGTVETAAAPFWRLLGRYAPGCRVVTIRRPVPDVVASLARVGMVPDGGEAVVTRFMERLDAKLDQIEARLPGVMSVRYEDLAEEVTCARLFEFCTGTTHDHAWWAACDKVRIEVDMSHVSRHFLAHRPQLEKLARIAWRRCLAEMTREPREIDDGLTFQHEPFRAFWRDVGPLISEHALEAGEGPDYPDTFNIPMLETLDDLGMLQTITARQNGRMFGYLLSVVTPTIESPHMIDGWHTIFYASPDMPGIGMRLQRAALDGLRARGATQVFMRAGYRASGPRLGAFYRRLGAMEIGKMFRLELN